MLNTIDIKTANSASDHVSLYSINQATRANFTDLYFRQTFLFFIHSGSKKIVCPINGEMLGETGDVIICPPNARIASENRPLQHHHYQADGVCFSQELVNQVFADQRVNHPVHGVQILPAATPLITDMLTLIKQTLANGTLPATLRQHRFLEPLLWLRHHGIRLPSLNEDLPLNRVQALLETDLAHPWRVRDVAQHLAMSEPSFRRWLAKSGQGFAKILLNMRLEKALLLLQTTDAPISQIALHCGFNTPSHFSESFRKRFGLKPKMIRVRSE